MQLGDAVSGTAGIAAMSRDLHFRSDRMSQRFDSFDAPPGKRHARPITATSNDFSGSFPIMRYGIRKLYRLLAQTAMLSLYDPALGGRRTRVNVLC